MAEPFRANFDSSGRIVGFRPLSSPSESFEPEEMFERLDGGETLTLAGVAYRLTEEGNLIHPEVDVIETVELGYGVRLDAGVSFHASRDRLPDPAGAIVIDDRTRIQDTSIEDGVEIGRHNSIRALF